MSTESILKKAELEDSSFLLELRNEPIYRSMSINSDLVSEKEHASWFEKALADSSKFIFIIINKNEKIGSIRLEKKEDSKLFLSVALIPEARNKGLGRSVINRACLQALELGFNQVCAIVKNENKASQKAFNYAGFELLEKDSQKQTFIWRKNC